MAKRSNKTAHVLNLLSGGLEEKKEPEAKPEEAVTNATTADPTPEPSAPAAKPASIQTVEVIDKTENDPLAALIEEKLAEEFEKELAQNAAPKDNKAAEVEKTEAAANESAVEPVTDDTVGKSEATVIEPTLKATANNIVGKSEATVMKAAVEPTTDTVRKSEATVTEPALESTPDNTVEKSESAVTGVAVSADSAVEEPKAAVMKPTVEAVTSNAVEKSETTVIEPTLEAVTDNSVEKSESAITGAALEPVINNATKKNEAAITEPDLESSADNTAEMPAPTQEPDFVSINLMEQIVKDKIIYFMREFDVCTCERCKADTIALTLNGLKPKYIVTMPAAAAPLVSYYTNRYISDITVEATKACMTIKENPRH